MEGHRLALLLTGYTQGLWPIRMSSNGKRNGTKTGIKKKRWIVTGLYRNGTTRSMNKDWISYLLNEYNTSYVPHLRLEIFNLQKLYYTLDDVSLR